MITEQDVVNWLTSTNATLIGKAVDVSKPEGQEWFASWFIGILREVESAAVNAR